MKYDLQASKSVGQRAAMGVGLIAMIWAAYAVCHDPYEDSFDFPDTVDLATWRIQTSFAGLVGAAQGSIKDTNDSMQNTVDDRNRLNDGRIRRDVKP
jgi:hypothetical protein